MCASQFCFYQPCLLEKVSDARTGTQWASEDGEQESSGSYIVCPCAGCINDTLREYNEYRPKLASMINDVCRDSPEARHIDRHIHERLHILWIGFFTELFQNFYLQYGENWMLKPYDSSHNSDIDCCINSRQSLWQTTVKARVRFDCECGHVWTSQMGKAKFWVNQVRLLPVPGTKQLVFRLLTQDCTQCPLRRSTPAAWYPYEVIRVLLHVYNRISEEYGGQNNHPVAHPSTALSQPFKGHQAATPFISENLSLQSYPLPTVPEINEGAGHTQSVSNKTERRIQSNNRKLLKSKTTQDCVEPDAMSGDALISGAKKLTDCDNTGSEKPKDYFQKLISSGGCHQKNR